MSEAMADEAEQLAALVEDWAALTHAKSAVIVAEGEEAHREAAHVAEALAKRIAIRVARDWSDVTACDLVVLHRETAHSAWAARLAELGKLAGKALMVVVKNPRGWLDRVDTPADAPPAPMCHTKTIAPVLWQIGRVREHVFFQGGRLGIVDQLAPSLRPRVARLHAFLVDTTPRTPQARRKLHVV